MPNPKKLLIPLFALTLAGGALASAQVSGEREGPVAPADRVLEAGDVELKLDDAGSATGASRTTPTGESPTTGTARSTEGCPEGFTGNHGQFVSGTEERPRRDAARSPCGKPVQSVRERPEAEGDEVSEPRLERDERQEQEEEQARGKGRELGHEKQGSRGRDNPDRP